MLSGCFVATWVRGPAAPQLKPVDNDTLPEDLPSLLELADAKMASGTTIEEMGIAVGALEKAAKLLGDRKPTVVAMGPIDIQLKLAMACRLAAEVEPDSVRKLAWLAKGEGAAEALRTAWPDRVEGYYFLAVVKGRQAEQGGLSGIVQVHTVEDLALKAEQIDPTYEDGGPLRLLAMLYANAPPWPTSIGDIDLALEYAEKAIKVSDYPLNHLFLAEVLIETEDFPRAREELRKVLAAPKVGRWAGEGERWRPHAEMLARQIDSQ